MSINLSNAAVTQFDDMVKQEYQSKGLLRPAVTNRTGITGLTYSFTRMSRGVANQKATQADITPMNIEHARQSINLERWVAGEFTDVFDADEVNFDEMQELAFTVGRAISRRDDQIIIDSMNAITTATTNDGDPDTGLQIVEGSANLTVTKLRRAAQHFNEIGDANERHIAITPAGLNSLLEDSEVTSTDFNTVRALVDGAINSYLGFTFHTLPLSQDEGGLPQTGNIVSAFAWDKAAVGIAVGKIDKMVRIDYVPTKTSHLTVGLLRSGAIAREPQGIVQIDYDVTA